MLATMGATVETKLIAKSSDKVAREILEARHPELPKMACHIQKSFTIGLRFNKAAIAQFNYLMIDEIAKKLHSFLPEEKYGPTATVVSTGAAGVATGLTHTFFDVIILDKIFNAQYANDTKRITSPSGREIAAELFQQGGVKAFRRGLIPSLLLSSYIMGLLKFTDFVITKLSQMQIGDSLIYSPNKDATLFNQWRLQKLQSRQTREPSEGDDIKAERRPMEHPF